MSLIGKTCWHNVMLKRLEVKVVKKLTLVDAKSVQRLAWPESGGEIDLDSPALRVFTDFLTTKPLILESAVSAVDAEKLMLTAHVRMKIVVDEDANFLGIVSLEDLNSHEFIVKIAQGDKREELSIVDFMKPKSRLKGFQYAELSNASIRDVVMALKDSDQQHCIVIDSEQRRIRGIISASDVVRKLRLPINILNDSIFSSIYRAIRH